MKFKVSYDTEDAEERVSHGSTRLFPILKCTAFNEPRCSTLVMRISRNEVIYRRIWRRVKKKNPPTTCTQYYTPPNTTKYSHLW